MPKGVLDCFPVTMSFHDGPLHTSNDFPTKHRLGSILTWIFRSSSYTMQEGTALLAASHEKRSGTYRAKAPSLS